MALRSQLYWWAECDVCGRSAQENHDITAWADKASATEAAEDGEWTVLIDGERIVHLCPTHAGASWEWCPSCESDLDSEGTVSITEDEVIQHCPSCHHIRTLALTPSPEQYTANGEDPR